MRAPLQRPAVRAFAVDSVTLRSRLLLLVLAILLPALVIAAWLIARTYDSERMANANTLRETTRALPNRVDSELARRAAVARALSLLPELDAAPNITPALLASFEQQARRALGGFEGWVELRLPAGHAALEWPTDPGVLRLLADEERVAGPSVLLQPVVRDGKVRANLTVTVSPAEFQRLLDEQRLPTDWTGAVLDSSGTVVASLLLLGVALFGAMWLSRRIAGSVHVLERAAADLQAGRPVERRSSGILEFDDVAAALADASESMRHAHADLEQQVAAAVELTRAAERRQSQGQRIEALGRLTGGLAHDFNNLLGVISNSAYLMERQVQAQPALAAPVAAVLRAVDLGSRLTQHLVRFAGRRPVSPQSLALDRFLPEIQELLTAALGKRVRLSTQVAPGTWPVVVDASEFELALINLALNARDAIVNTGQLWLQARNAVAADTLGLTPGRYVLVLVNDDGPGVDEQAAQHAFEPFYTTKSMGKGIGLGLPQVHGFALQAGGSAGFKSTPGIGTTVSLLLPAAAALEAGTPGQTLATGAPERNAAQPDRALAGVRVLLVEDNRDLGDATEALLETHGATVVRADNASQALQWLATGASTDVVLSDVVMPGAMDGLALAQALRTRQPQLPVVLISGHSHALADPQGFPILRKPCAPQTLIAALLVALKAGAPAS